MESSGLHTCVQSKTLDSDWQALYHEAFPVDEREPEEKLARLIDINRALYHRTENAAGKLLCFTLVSVAPDHLLLAFMATDKNQRGGGYGSKHLSRLIEVLQEKYPKHLGMFIEIEAVNPHSKVLNIEEQTINQRRRDFYLRHGAVRVCPNAIYLTPNRGPHGGDWEGELLFVPFGGISRISKSTVLRVLTEIYQRFYCLPASDGLIARALANFHGCKSVDCAKHGHSCCLENDACMDDEPLVIDELADAECTFQVEKLKEAEPDPPKSLWSSFWACLFSPFLYLYDVLFGCDKPCQCKEKKAK